VRSLSSFLKEIAASAGFVPVSDGDRKQKKNIARNTNQDVVLFKDFLRQTNLQKLGELTPHELDSSLKTFIISLRKYGELVVNHHFYLPQASKKDKVSEDEKLSPLPDQQYFARN